MSEVPPDTATDTTKVHETTPAEHEVKEDTEHGEGEQLEGEVVEGEHVEGEHQHVEGEHIEGEHVEGEQTESEGGEKVLGEGEVAGEGVEGEQTEEGGGGGGVVEKKEDEEMVMEEEAYVEPPPPDPTAPYNLSDSQELLKEPFSLRNDQLAEAEQLWALYQDYTPAYTDIDNYITKKELIYMLEALMLTTNTPEQLEELLIFCIRPPHPKGHITFDQFIRIITLRQRSAVIEEELRAALQLLDPQKTGLMDREQFRELLLTTGNKMSPKQVQFLIKEVDIAGDGTIGVEDVVGTMGIDLNKDDIIMLRQAVYGNKALPIGNEDED